ncbi:MAG TPA: helix-turn-helix domain-containing protein [Candidatus Baltobacteraceae bacterium]|nr:helix-turn-helix domain-containing protein [Candidatus Baltobacteraceae bacterium]
MEPVARKVVYRLYPSHSQETALLDMLGLHQRLYNAALEQRKTAWRLQRKSLSAYDQMRDLTDLRADDERYAALNAQSAQVTLHRLHLAFAAFFRRCKKGETPGFPRFRSFDREERRDFGNAEGRNLRGDRARLERHGNVVRRTCAHGTLGLP